MKVFLPLKIITIVVVFVVWLPTANGQTRPKVTKIEIKHVGPASASDALIQSNIRVKIGEAFQRANVDDDIRNLYSTGYFSNIRVGEEESPEGIKLIYVLQGKPLLTAIRFVGNTKYSNNKIQKKISSKVGDPLDEKKLFFDAQEIEKMYQKAGYQKTTVKPLPPVVDENTGRGTATFEIKETPKVKIKELVFDNAKAFKQSKLRKVLKTKQRWWMSWLTGSGVLKDDEFEDDKDRLVEHYQNNGYIDFEIKDVKFNYRTDSKLEIHFDVAEGSRYRVGNIAFKGTNLFSPDDIMKGIVSEGKRRRMEMKVGEIFTPVGLTKDLEAIRDFYGAKGFIDTKVAAIKSPNMELGTLDLTYEIDERDKSYIEKIEIKGNTKTKDKVIRRELAVAPGEVYDMVRVKLSAERLRGLQYFEKVEPQPEETEIQDRKNLVIGVEEKNTGNLTVGAGLSSVDSVVGFVELSQGNFDLFKPPTFTGGGQKFRLRVAIGTERKDFQITFIEPWFLNRKLEFSTDLYHRDLRFLSDIFDEKRTGGSLGLRKAIGNEFLIGRVSYTLESVGLDFIDDPARVSPEIKQFEGTRLVSKVGASLAYDTRNSALTPTRGQKTELATEFAGGPFLGDSDFYKVELKSDWYFPAFFDGHVFEVGARTGISEAYDDTTTTPLFDRYFLGGAYSMRGYRYRKVGPANTKDRFNEPLGGQSYWYGTMEYSLPIIERLRFALFYDIGNINALSYTWDFNDFYDNYGIGLRINLPIGPLVLDYGIPWHHPNDSTVTKSGRFNFRVGYSRDF